MAAQLPQLSGIAWGDFNRGLIEEVQARNEKPIVKRAAEIFAVPGIHILRLRLAGQCNQARPRARNNTAPRYGSSPRVSKRMPCGCCWSRRILADLNVLDLHGNYANDSGRGGNRRWPVPSTRGVVARQQHHQQYRGDDALALRGT